MDLDEVRTFYDPHPGFAGAAVPIPEKVRRVANELDGQTLSLREAVERIQAATTGKVRVVAEYQFIGLLIKGRSFLGPCEHFFRVICYR